MNKDLKRKEQEQRSLLKILCYPTDAICVLISAPEESIVFNDNSTIKKILEATLRIVEFELEILQMRDNVLIQCEETEKLKNATTLEPK